MDVTERTRDILAYRRAIKRFEDRGYIRVAENGDPLWKLHRGNWVGKKITDVLIAPGGIELWIKIH